jgi:RNA polymerase sigma factor (sigma-70 family)
MTAPDDEGQERAHNEELDPPSDDRSARTLAVLLDHRREFLGFLERRLGDRALAEDLLQDAFARLDRLSSLREQESAVAWFYRVLRNATVDFARKRASSARKLEAFARELEAAEEPAANPDVQASVCKCVSALKESLKPSYRDAIDRIDLEGIAVKDYAEQAGISPSNAAVRVFRARNALREQVARSCGACAEHGCLDCTCHEG